MITYGVIGTGWITDTWITSSTANWKLGAVYSRSEETAKQFGAKYSCSNTHTSLESLAADPSIQAVYIASPNNFHHAQAKLILSAKKHVILEKPATSTVPEFDDLVKTAAENKVFLIEAYRHIQEANFKVLKQNLARLGPVYGGSFTYAQYSSRYNAVLAGEKPNIFNLDFSGGALVDLGVYPITAAVALFGKPVSQTYHPVMIATGADGGGVITLNYEGFGVQVNASKIYNSSAPSEVYGEKGTLVIDTVERIKKVSFWDAKTKGKEELAVVGEEGGMPMMHEEEAVEFARIIEEGDQGAVKALEEVSRIVLEVTGDLRRKNGLVFKVEKE
ncbi:oxidoreductase-like protein [Aulographum hederae CBS 113979]|uniref:Oxidoreductase-like protein n=1 Tax=Aulographum hederae CBS 113979 TaxID=1176131 RepID=A0A6G1GZP2_9PEZI|nr:oxidoreductase-like protein [Aulographum hederae CBS 113979]